jgi:hypothetical protein
MKYDYLTMINGLGGTATNLEAFDVTSTVPDQAVYPQ